MKALVLTLALVLPSTQLGPPLFYSDKATLQAAVPLCTESACVSQCYEWVNNPFCLVRAAHCMANNSCYCASICFAPGQRPHLAVSCEDREDSSHP